MSVDNTAYAQPGEHARDAQSGEGKRAQLPYRPDLDGLRGIAVAAVVFQHAGLPGIPGAFVGLDLFFVISGFLITTLLHARIAAGEFTFSGFYLNRIRRLVPAASVVIFCTTLTGVFVLLPSDQEELAVSGLWSLFSGANFYFLEQTVNYFQPDSADLPLLHMWSLSVEEQFYLLWPLLLFFAVRFLPAKALLFATAGLSGLSFSFGQYLLPRFARASYFLLPSRAGGLLLGCALALFFVVYGNKLRKDSWLGVVLGLLGTVLVAAPAFYLSSMSPFPGFNSFVPCFGAILLIAAYGFGANPATWLLSTPALVFLGRISYSLYLWHWPLMSFISYRGIALSLGTQLAFLALCICLGSLSYFFIENRYRYADRDGRFHYKTIAAVFFLAVLIQVIVLLEEGFKERFAFETLSRRELIQERQRYWRKLEEKIQAHNTRRQHAHRVAVIGNSHAVDLAYALIENDYPATIDFLSIDHTCLDFCVGAITPDRVEPCARELEEIIASSAWQGVDAVYLATSWRTVDAVGLRRVFEQFRARTSAPIYVFGPKMRFTKGVARIARNAVSSGELSPGGINAYARQFYAPIVKQFDLILKGRFAAGHVPPGFFYVSAVDLQCGSPPECKVISDSWEYLYFDDNHFTLLGARDFGKKLRERFPDGLFATGQGYNPRIGSKGDATELARQ